MARATSKARELIEGDDAKPATTVMTADVIAWLDGAVVLDRLAADVERWLRET